jgi:hypothetical protein
MCMAKRTKTETTDRATDAKQVAHDFVGFASGTTTYASLSEYMSAMGRKGGKKGGKRRLETMTPEERTGFARNAALARWKAKPQKPGH